MKKFTLFVCAMAVSTAMFAAPHAKTFESTKAPKFKVMEAQLEVAPIKKKAQVATDTLLVPYSLITPDFKSYAIKYQVGKPSDGLRYNYYSQGLVLPYQEEVVFFNDSVLTATWLVDDAIVSEGVPYYQESLHFGENPLPIMKTAGNADTLYLDYQPSGLNVKYWHEVEEAPDFYSTLMVAPAEFVSITKCAMYTEDARNSEDGSDWVTNTGHPSIGSYAYGTKMKNPWDGGYFDTIAIPFDNNGVMVIDHFTAAIFNQSGAAAMFPAEGDHIRVTVFPSNAKGYPDWKNPLATATANADNYTKYSSTYSWLGLLEFDFMEEDPVTGAMTPAPITVEGDFWLAFDEFNDGTANFGFLSDYYVGDGETYMVGRDSETGEQYLTGLWVEKANLLLSLDAYFPVFNAPEVVTFAAGETKKEFDVPSNVWSIAELVEDIEWDAPEWIDVDIESVYEVDGEGEEANYTHKFINKLTIKVEESSEKREGTIEFNAFGLEGQILVKQNDDTQAINSVKAVNDNKLYNVLGQEVSEDYKGVVIRNGEKFVR